MTTSRDWPLSLAERCRRVELLVLDVDGVLTSGGIRYAAGDGPLLEGKVFHVRDGSALKAWHAAGKRSAVLTGRRSRAVDVRAAELGVTAVVQGASDKGVSLAELLARLGLSPEAVAAVGDDVPDVPVLRACGLAVAVADACAEARAAAHHVTGRPGGRGAVREVIELVLRCQGLWPGPGARQGAKG
jgi:3-deoxy-D-manno-octulosonate 8-phosphate phosphatase (KDO 8-P phosphatase)